MVMLKTTLITAIIHCLIYFITRLLMATMTEEEKAVALVAHHHPTRVLIFSGLWLVSLILTIVFLILTIVRW